MKKTILISFALVVSFAMGFAFNSFVTNKWNAQQPLKRVTGIGGIFFKCKNPEKMRNWYHEHLGLSTDKYGTNFEWRLATDSTKKGFTVWSPFTDSTSYFQPSVKDFMINYRVADLSALVKALKQEGIETLDSIEVYDYGKFVHLLDIEGNKIELWEPNDIVYDKFEGGRTK